MNIRRMKETDKAQVMDMMRVFYNSPAVFSNGSEEIFERDVENCMNENPFLEGYVFTEGNSITGYGMIVKSFSTEFGKACIWVEDIYIKEEYRGQGIGQEFLGYVIAQYSDAIIRLEVERENECAVHVYEKSGFKELPYQEMVRLTVGK